MSAALPSSGWLLIISTFTAGFRPCAGVLPGSARSKEGKREFRRFGHQASPLDLQVYDPRELQEVGRNCPQATRLLSDGFFIRGPVVTEANTKMSEKIETASPLTPCVQPFSRPGTASEKDDNERHWRFSRVRIAKKHPKHAMVLMVTHRWAAETGAATPPRPYFSLRTRRVPVRELQLQSSAVPEVATQSPPAPRPTRLATRCVHREILAHRGARPFSLCLPGGKWPSDD